jgi:hypothetical protein
MARSRTSAAAPASGLTLRCKLNLTFDLDTSLCKGFCQQRFCSRLRDDAHVEGGFDGVEINLGKWLPVLIPAQMVRTAWYAKH